MSFLPFSFIFLTLTFLNHEVGLTYRAFVVFFILAQFDKIDFSFWILIICFTMKIFYPKEQRKREIGRYCSIIHLLDAVCNAKSASLMKYEPNYADTPSLLPIISMYITEQKKVHGGSGFGKTRISSLS